MTRRLAGFVVASSVVVSSFGCGGSKGGGNDGAPPPPAANDGNEEPKVGKPPVAPIVAETPEQQRAKYVLGDVVFSGRAFLSSPERKTVDVAIKPGKMPKEFYPADQNRIHYYEVQGEPLLIGPGEAGFTFKVFADREFKELTYKHRFGLISWSLSCLDDGIPDQIETSYANRDETEETDTESGFHIKPAGVKDLAAAADDKLPGCTKLVIAYEGNWRPTEDAPTQFVYVMIPVRFH